MLKLLRMAGSGHSVSKCILSSSVVNLNYQVGINRLSEKKKTGLQGRKVMGREKGAISSVGISALNGFQNI